MTKFMTLSPIHRDGIKETVFKKVVIYDGKTQESLIPADEWDNVMFIGHDRFYGDVFKTWDEGSDDFTLYFGKKGDEFND